MVHPGHPSGACSTCKARRIKCDETRPQCGRCTKSNRACLGYPTRASDRRATQNDVQTNTLQLRTRQLPFAEIGLQIPLHAAGHVTVHFGENFILNPSGNPYDVSPGFLDGLESVLAQYGHHSVLRNVVEVFSISHKSLGEAVQTLRQRNEQFCRYQQAIRDVKQSIFLPARTQSTAVSIFLLALFEMLVNSCSIDKTWQTHLNGLLTLFRQPTPLQTIYPMAGNFSHTMLCLDDLQARFHYLSPELDRIFRESTTPRKLDVQKLRTAMKNIFKDLVLTRSVMSKEQPWCYTASRSSVQESHATSLDGAYPGYVWNKLQAMLIASAIFLQESGEYLSGGNTWRATSEFEKLTRIIQEAVTTICLSAARRFRRDLSQSIPLLSTGPCFFRTIDGLLWMWPLYVASNASGILDTQRRWIKNTLFDLGLIGGIPKASMLAQNKEQRLNYYEFSSAFTLLNFGFIVTRPYFD